MVVEADLDGNVNSIWPERTLTEMSAPSNPDCDLVPGNEERGEEGSPRM